jgi:hypothetical protein
MSTSIARIGILSPVTEAGMKDWWQKLKEGLEELDYVEGRNIEFVRRFGDGKFDRLPGLAAELAALGVDVIMPATPPAIYAAKSALTPSCICPTRWRWATQRELARFSEIQDSARVAIPRDYRRWGLAQLWARLVDAVPTERFPRQPDSERSKAGRSPDRQAM